MDLFPPSSAFPKRANFRLRMIRPRAAKAHTVQLKGGSGKCFQMREHLQQSHCQSRVTQSSNVCDFYSIMKLLVEGCPNISQRYSVCRNTQEANRGFISLTELFNRNVGNDGPWKDKHIQHSREQKLKYLFSESSLRTRNDRSEAGTLKPVLGSTKCQQVEATSHGQPRPRNTPMALAATTLPGGGFRK